MTAPNRAPWLCRLGLHAWRLLEAGPSREIGAGTPGATYICDRRDRCQRCDLTVRRRFGSVPGRHVRIYQERKEQR